MLGKDFDFASTDVPAVGDESIESLNDFVRRRRSCPWKRIDGKRPTELSAAALHRSLLAD